MSAEAAARTTDPVELRIRRAVKMRQRGDVRRAVVLLREACSLDEWRARSWTLLGALLSDVGAPEEAARALRHACWLRARAGEHAREAVTSRLLDRVLRAA